jgi:hypothetical protein
MHCLKLRHIDMPAKSPLHFGGIRAFEEQLHRFLQIRRRLFLRVSLAGDIQFRTKGNVPISLLL